MARSNARVGGSRRVLRTRRGRNRSTANRGKVHRQRRRASSQLVTGNPEYLLRSVASVSARNPVSKGSVLTSMVDGAHRLVRGFSRLRNGLASRYPKLAKAYPFAKAVGGGLLVYGLAEAVGSTDAAESAVGGLAMAVGGRPRRASRSSSSKPGQNETEKIRMNAVNFSISDITDIEGALKAISTPRSADIKSAIVGQLNDGNSELSPSIKVSPKVKQTATVLAETAKQVNGKLCVIELSTPQRISQLVAMTITEGDNLVIFTPPNRKFKGNFFRFLTEVEDLPNAITHRTVSKNGEFEDTLVFNIQNLWIDNPLTDEYVNDFKGFINLLIQAAIRSANFHLTGKFHKFIDFREYSPEGSDFQSTTYTLNLPSISIVGPVIAAALGGFTYVSGDLMTPDHLARAEKMAGFRFDTLMKDPMPIRDVIPPLLKYISENRGDHQWLGDCLKEFEDRFLKQEDE